MPIYNVYWQWCMPHQKNCFGLHTQLITGRSPLFTVQLTVKNLRLIKGRIRYTNYNCLAKLRLINSLTNFLVTAKFATL